MDGAASVTDEGACTGATAAGGASEDDILADGRESITVRPARVSTTSPSATSRSTCRRIDRAEQPIRSPSSSKVSAVQPRRPSARSTTSAPTSSVGEHSPAVIAVISCIES